jgi:enoyl-CoA hydratase/carnithine racemase
LRPGKASHKVGLHHRGVIANSIAPKAPVQEALKKTDKDSQMAGVILVEKRGPIGVLTFSNEARLNAVSQDMWKSIPPLLEDLETDDGVRAMVVTGAGTKAFVSGADISEFEKNRNSAEASRLYDAASSYARDRLRKFRKPTIAKIRGYCIGGGLAVALTCDIRIASEDAKFGIPAAKLGLGYGAPGLRMLMELVGPAMTKDILFSARQLSAQEALRVGLINAVVPAAELDAHVEKYTAAVAQNAPLTIYASKVIVGELLKDAAERDEQLCEQLVDTCMSSADYAEGRRAFMEKRKPQFMGK